MSMNGLFRQVSPRALEILQARPELIPDVIDFEPAEPEAAAPDPLPKMPPGIRAMFDTLPPAQQQKMLAQYAKGVAMMKANPLAAQVLQGRGDAANGLGAAGITAADLPEALDIGKTWHGLHFLLAATVWEAGPGAAAAVLGGREIGDEVVYGPARVMTPAETADTAAALAALTESELAARHDPRALEAAEIYGVWEDVEELLEAFREVRDYYAAARELRFGMLLAIV